MNSTRIDQLLKFLEANPGDSFVKFALALEYIGQRDDEKGLMFFTQILEHDPDYTGTYYHLGKLYERLNKKEEAEKTYREGLKRTLGKDLKANQELQEALNQMMYGEDE